MATSRTHRIPAETKARFIRCINEGMSMRQAALMTGVSYSWARSYAQGHRSRSEQMVSAARKNYSEVEALGRPLYESERCKEANRAFDDFVYFRQRYFGRNTPPWQALAADVLVERLADPLETYDVWNMPPGSGKTTFFHDVVCWAIVRDRRIRVLYGSANEANAAQQTNRIRRSLERMTPMRASIKEKGLGMAMDAEGCLGVDYGIFRPAERLDIWRAAEFVVVQDPEYGAIDDKEFTVQAVGEDTGYLGRRFDVEIWDDLVTADSIKITRVDAQREKWDTIAENRLDPGGALFLVGQRMGPDDLYRYCLDKSKDYDADEDDPYDIPLSYKHVVFPAHDETRCTGDHGRDAKYWPEGCLLDPLRLSWPKLRAKQANPTAYAVQYQQEDTDPQGTLVRPVWIDGGTDPVTQALHFGCWDNQRSIGQIPADLKGKVISYATVDPSASKWWAIQWWLYAPDTRQQIFLIDIADRRMSSPDLLEYHVDGGYYSGIMAEWQERSKQLGAPITAWIVEINAAQRYLVQHEFVRNWLQTANTRVIPHATSMNKLDPALGVQATASWWASGQIRLPGLTDADRARCLPLTKQVTAWPLMNRDDQVMAHWFGIFHLQHLTPLTNPKELLAARPSWVKNHRDWRTG